MKFLYNKVFYYVLLVQNLLCIIKTIFSLLFNISDQIEKKNRDLIDMGVPSYRHADAQMWLNWVFGQKVAHCSKTNEKLIFLFMRFLVFEIESFKLLRIV